MNKINETFGSDVAKALDPVSVVRRQPTQRRVSFKYGENLGSPVAEPPEIVINSRTGTVVTLGR